jgi:hypothetical protein
MYLNKGIYVRSAELGHYAVDDLDAGPSAYGKGSRLVGRVACVNG